MICLSQTTGYTIRALACLDDRPGRPRLIRQVAACSGVSRPYLAKILNQLVRSGLLVAKRGYRGGIALARPAGQISLLEVVKAIEGEQWIGPCLLGIGECYIGAVCPTYDLWREVRSRIETALKETTVADITEFIRTHPRVAEPRAGGATLPAPIRRRAKEKSAA